MALNFDNKAGGNHCDNTPHLLRYRAVVLNLGPGGVEWLTSFELQNEI